MNATTLIGSAAQEKPLLDVRWLTFAFAIYPVFYLWVRWYEGVYGWRAGLDAFAPEFETYWMNFLYTAVVMETIAGSILWQLLWKTRCRNLTALAPREELRRNFTHMTWLTAFASAIYWGASYFTEQDATWHQTIIRDTDFTPSHILTFYVSYPIFIITGGGAFLYAKTRLPYFAEDVSLPYLVMVVGTCMMLPSVGLNEWGHTFWFMEELFVAPVHWGFVIFGWLALAVLGTLTQTFYSITKLIGRDICEACDQGLVSNCPVKKKGHTIFHSSYRHSSYQSYKPDYPFIIDPTFRQKKGHRGKETIYVKTPEKAGPRVLNAGFADPETRRVFHPDQPLMAGRDYDFLVDVGPRWDKITSLVTGNSDFPDVARWIDSDGCDIDVVLRSEDFLPRQSSAQIWVPRDRGRSFAVDENGNRSLRSGPVALRIRSPRFQEGTTEVVRAANASLRLYYKNNLLQSAVVSVMVARYGGVTLKPSSFNSIEVDYMLSGGFQDLQDSFADRHILGGKVALNLAIDGHRMGDHHITVKGGVLSRTVVSRNTACSPTASIPYDSEAGANLLKEARRNIRDCFFLWNNGAKVKAEDGEPICGLNQNTNGKDLEQFKNDIQRLALFGRKLWTNAFNQVIPENPYRCNATEWQRNLRSLLTVPSLIQVARTGSAQYVYPWAMLYEYPLIISEGEPKWCRIIDEEWGDNGVRHNPPAEERTACKYHAEGWHQKNVICPYGFWGLKHLLEVPLSLHELKDERRLGNAKKDVRISGPFTLSMGVTGDSNYQARIEKHLQNLKNLGARLQPIDPASNWEAVRAMLKEPEIIYFLCHNEYDKNLEEDYLSIGPRDDNPAHRIYVQKTLAEWQADPLDGPNTDVWKQRGPLVFINGCYTADLSPGQIVSFTTVFSGLGANGVLGTEISVDLSVAIEVAESFFRKIGPPNYQEFGSALRQVRWDLANKGNLLGLAYTLYGLADLHVVPGNGEL